MKTTVRWLGALLLAGVAVPALHAQSYPGCHIACHPPYCAPDACDGGFYWQHPCGGCFGPNYCVRPPWEPFNGFAPCPAARLQNPAAVCPQAAYARPGLPPPPAILRAGAPPQYPYGGPPGSPVFPTHPYARSPRDYFMID
jgi:hypothetical protein